MLVGVINININELARHTQSVDSFKSYSDSLVPIEFRHNQAILSNQLYLCCVTLRKSDNVPWDIKKPLVNEVMNNLSIVGYADSLVEVRQLYSVVNMDEVRKYMR